MLTKIGTGELFVIIVIALFVIGPDKLPGVAKKAGRTFFMARKFLRDITKEMEEEFKDIKDDIDDLETDLKNALKEPGETNCTLPAPIESAPLNDTASSSDMNYEDNDEERPEEEKTILAEK